MNVFTRVIAFLTSIKNSFEIHDELIIVKDEKYFHHFI